MFGGQTSLNKVGIWFRQLRCQYRDPYMYLINTEYFRECLNGILILCDFPVIFPAKLNMFHSAK